MKEKRNGWGNVSLVAQPPEGCVFLGKGPQPQPSHDDVLLKVVITRLTINTNACCTEGLALVWQGRGMHLLLVYCSWLCLTYIHTCPTMRWLKHLCGMYLACHISIMIHLFIILFWAAREHTSWVHVSSWKHVILYITWLIQHKARGSSR